MAANPKADKIAKCNFSPYQKVIGKLFTDDTADVLFHVLDEDGEAKTIRAHTKYLAAISLVFESMFRGNWKEKDSVKVEDVKFDMFNMFMQCLYGEEREINEDNVPTLLYLSKKYNIDDMVSSCSAFMVQQLSIDNVLNYLKTAITYDLDALQHSCENIIGKNTLAILEQPQFLNCGQNILSTILKLNKISCSEGNVFDGCMKWAKQRCSAKELEESGENIRSELGNCFSLIRFKEIGSAEFVKRLKVYNRGLFSVDLLSDLWVFFGEGNVIVDKRYQTPEMRVHVGNSVYHLFP